MLVECEILICLKPKGVHGKICVGLKSIGHPLFGGFGVVVEKKQALFSWSGLEEWVTSFHF